MLDFVILGYTYHLPRNHQPNLNIYVMSPVTLFFESLLFIFVSGSLLLFVLGFISPDKSLFWLKGKRTRIRSAIIYATAFIAGMFLVNLWYPAPPAGKKTGLASSGKMHMKTDAQIAKEVFEETGKYYTKGLIKSSTVYTYDSLPEDIRKLAPEPDMLTKDAHTGTNSAANPERKGYYVRLVLDNNLLAKASSSDTYRESELLRETDPRALYGPNRNSFSLYDTANTEIRHTEKHMGFNLFYVRRDYNIDTICIGPCPEKPAKVRINCYQQAQTTDPIEYTF